MEVSKNELEKDMFDAVSRLEIRRALSCVKKGANINAFNKDGQTALTILSKASRFDYVWFTLDDYLEEVPHGEKMKRIMIMKKIIERVGIDFNKVEMDVCLFDKYIKNVADIKQPDRIELMKQLIGAGASVNLFKKSKYKTGGNALYWAVRTYEVNTVHFLLSQGAKPNLKFIEDEGDLLSNTRLDLQIAEEEKKKFESSRMYLLDGLDYDMVCEKIAHLKRIVSLLKRAKQ